MARVPRIFTALAALLAASSATPTAPSGPLAVRARAAAAQSSPIPTIMPEDTILDPTNKGTLRPEGKALQKKGDVFYSMNLPNFNSKIHLPEHVNPNEPISLFAMYYTLKIMDLMVEKTNEHIRKPKDESKPYA